MGDLGGGDQSDGGVGNSIPYPDVGTGSDGGGDDNGVSTTKEVDFDVTSAAGDDTESGATDDSHGGVISPTTDYGPSTFASSTSDVLAEGSGTVPKLDSFGHGADSTAQEDSETVESEEKQEVSEEELGGTSTFYDPNPPVDETGSMGEPGDWRPFDGPFVEAFDDISFGVERFDDAKPIDEPDGFDEIIEG